jgi:hypothetical protein
MPEVKDFMKSGKMNLNVVSHKKQGLFHKLKRALARELKTTF